MTKLNRRIQACQVIILTCLVLILALASSPLDLSYSLPLAKQDDTKEGES